MFGFTYTLTLLEPVLANSLGGEPNSANSLYYVPGGLIRGAAINAYKGTKKTEDPDFQNFRRLFLTGETRFLNAYPISKYGRSLPTPLKYKKPKYFDGSDLSYAKHRKICALEEIWQINVHTQRDAEAGHAKEDAGAVYRYIALPAGLTLQGAVLTESQKDADNIEKLLTSKDLLLGKARTAGYGAAHIDITSLVLLNERGNVPQSGIVSEFTLTLLSPAIVRDGNGQPSLDICHALKARLGIQETQKIEFKEIYQRSEIVGGFNRTWGMPLPQVTAIAAGSFFKVVANVDADQLHKLQDTGIGERRAEGFGRVAVNLSLPEIKEDDPWYIAKPSMKDFAQTKDKLEKNKTAALMLKRLGKKELDETVIHVAREITVDYPKGKIPNSQLSRWRVAARNALDKKGMQTLLKFLEDSKGKSGWKKMEKARIKISESERPRLTEWIEELLNDPTKLTRMNIVIRQNLSLGENAFVVDDALNLEYRLRLLDAVLAIMAKMNGGSNG